MVTHNPTGLFQTGSVLCGLAEDSILLAVNIGKLI
jgi:hypothetical protein